MCGFSNDEVCEWLGEKGLEYCVHTFQENMIDGAILQEMDDFDLVLLDVKKKDHPLIMELMVQAKEGWAWRKKEEEREQKKREKDERKKKREENLTSSSPVISSPVYPYPPCNPGCLTSPPRRKSKKNQKARKGSFLDKLLPALNSPKTSNRSHSHSPTKSPLSPLTLSSSSPTGSRGSGPPQALPHSRPTSLESSQPIFSSSSSPSFVPSKFTESDVRDWFLETWGGGGGEEFGEGEERGLGRYAEVLYKNCVDGEALMMLTPSDLRALGVCLEDMDHFVDVIDSLRKVDKKEKRLAREKKRQELVGDEEVAVVVRSPHEDSPSPWPSPPSVVIKVMHKKKTQYCPLYPQESFSSFSQRLHQVFPLSSPFNHSLSYLFPTAPLQVSPRPNQSPSSSSSPFPSPALPSPSDPVPPSPLLSLERCYTSPATPANESPWFGSPLSSPISTHLSPTLPPQSSLSLSSYSLPSDVAPSPPASPMLSLPLPSLSLDPLPSLPQQHFAVEDDEGMKLLFNHAAFLSKQDKKLRVFVEKTKTG